MEPAGRESGVSVRCSEKYMVCMHVSFQQSGYALAGCTVSPGFHFDDFDYGREGVVGGIPKSSIRNKRFNQILKVIILTAKDINNKIVRFLIIISNFISVQIKTIWLYQQQGRGTNGNRDDDKYVK